MGRQDHVGYLRLLSASDDYVGVIRGEAILLRQFLISDSFHPKGKVVNLLRGTNPERIAAGREVLKRVVASPVCHRLVVIDRVILHGVRVIEDDGSYNSAGNI
jgi:hypothetical protein